MNYFLIDGKVHAYESDGSQDAFIPEGAQPITEAEAIEIANPPQPTPTQFELDQRRYKRRAEVQTELIAWMAADNMSRVRNGEWTVQDLTALLADPALSAANQFMSTLSFELAAQAIQSSTNEILTQEIKTKWINNLQEHFYLENT